MKNILKVSTLLFLILLFSCSTRDDITDNNSLTVENIELIGILHNEYLSKVFKDFDYNSGSLFQNLKNNFTNLEVPKLTYEQKVKSIDFSFNSLNLKNRIDTNLMDLAFEKLFQFEYHSEFSKELSFLKDRANQQLMGSDLTVTLLYLEILDKSSYFWKPKNLEDQVKATKFY